MSLDLADYLKDLVAEGEKDSSGQFSLDFEKAREKLSKNLFAHPSNYLLKMVQFACAQGAAPIQVQTRRHDLQISFEGKPFSEDDLENLRKQLYQPEVEGNRQELKHLILALHAARAQQPEMLVFASRTPGSGRGLLFHGDQVRPIEIPPGPTAQMLLIRRKPKDSWLRQLFYSPRQLADDCHALTSRCRYSWSPVYLDGRLLSPAPFAFRGGTYPTLIDRYYLSRDTPQQLLAFDHFHERPALVYDVNGKTQNVDAVSNVLIHQWRSYFVPHYLSREHEPLYPSTSPPAEPTVRTDSWFGGNENSVLLYRGGYRRFSVNREKEIQVITVSRIGGFSSSIYSSKSWFSAPRPFPAGLGHVVCPATPTQEKSMVFFCQDGVLLEPVSMDLELKGLIVVLADPKVRCDLSGLQPIQNERLQAVTQWLLEESKKMKDELRKILRFSDSLGLSALGRSVNRMQNLGLED